MDALTNNKERLREFAASGYKDIVVDFFDAVIADMAHPDRMPTDSLEEVRAHKRFHKVLHEARDFFARLDQYDTEHSGEYE